MTRNAALFHVLTHVVVISVEKLVVVFMPCQLSDISSYNTYGYFPLIRIMRPRFSAKT